MFDGAQPEATSGRFLLLHRLRLDPIKHCDRCFFMVSSSSQAFFLDEIEESYNTNPPLIFYLNKSGFRSMCCLFSLFFFFGWATWGCDRVGHCPVDTGSLGPAGSPARANFWGQCLQELHLQLTTPHKQ